MTYVTSVHLFILLWLELIAQPLLITKGRTLTLPGRRGELEGVPSGRSDALPMLILHRGKLGLRCGEGMHDCPHPQ